jgi:hypothetical protein
MVMDHYHEKWRQIPYPYQQIPYNPGIPVLTEPPISDEEIREFRRLLERAKEYDKRNNEPDCEDNGKRKALLEIAKQFGIDISFL